MGQVEITFAGAPCIEAGFELSPGTIPSKGMIKVDGVTYDASVKPSIDISRRFGKGLILAFKEDPNKTEIFNLYVDRIQPEYDANGNKIVTIFVKDRRWLWQYAKITGIYNAWDEEKKEF